MALQNSVDRADLLIGGQRLPAQSGRYFETLDPANEQVIAQVAEADAADIDAAVVSARAAFEGDVPPAPPAATAPKEPARPTARPAKETEPA